ncbi:hypothetical protein GQ42DRAFT_151927 [Ramicandelaber brevisporus]|nr:hypothetical protein GQ42DRAFT_151927 [Ramicandelaber brevisporus]
MGIFGDGFRLGDQFYITQRADWQQKATIIPTAAVAAAASATTTTTTSSAVVGTVRSKTPSYSDGAKHSASPQNSADGFVYGVLGLGKPVSIKGTVHLNFPDSKPMMGHRIEARLSGKASVWWWEDKHKRVVHERIIDKCVTIWQSSEVSTSNTADRQGQLALADMPLTKRAIDFSIDDLPYSLPSIELSHNGQIRYKVQAIIYSNRTGPSSLFLNSDAKKTVEVPIRVYRPMMSTTGSMNLPHELELPNKYYWHSSHPNDSSAASIVPGSWECTVGPSRCLGPFEPAELSLQFKLAPHVTVKRIYLGIKQYSKIYHNHLRAMHTNKKYIASTERSDPEWQIKPASSSADAGVSVNVKMAIARPLDAMLTTGTTILRIFHNIKVKIYLKGAKNIEVEAPIFITPLTRAECDTLLRKQFGEPQTGFTDGVGGFTVGRLGASIDQVADPRFNASEALPPAYDAPSYDLPPYPNFHDGGDDSSSDDDNDGGWASRFGRKQRPPPEYSANEKH